MAQQQKKKLASGAKSASGRSNSPSSSFITESTKAVEAAISASAKTIANNVEEINAAQKSASKSNKTDFAGLAEATDAAVASLKNILELNSKNLESALESANAASEAAQSISGEVSDYANAVVAENVKLSENLLACRDVDDFLKLQSKFIKESIDNSFNRFLKIADIITEHNSAPDPFSENLLKALENFSKTINPK